MSEANVRTAMQEIAHRRDNQIPFRCRLGWHSWARWSERAEPVWMNAWVALHRKCRLCGIRGEEIIEL